MRNRLEGSCKAQVAQRVWTPGKCLIGPEDAGPFSTYREQTPMLEIFHAISVSVISTDNALKRAMQP